MRIRNLRRAAIVMLAAAWVLGPGAALGASVSGKSSTVLEWYDDPSGKVVPAYQYLLLNARDLGVEGLDFRGYGRLADDLNNNVDVDSALYYAFLEKRDVTDHLGLRLGRQLVMISAGDSVVDGLVMDWKRLGPMDLRLYGGVDVDVDDYDSDDLTWGGEVAGHFLDDDLVLGASYLQTWDDSALANEVIGADLNYGYRNLLDLYGDWQFNLLTEATSHFLGGFKYHRNPTWSLRGEYLYSLPVFESTSIYSVFAVAEYQELLGEVTYRFRPGLLGFGRYVREIYEDYADANVFEAGIEQIATGRFSGYLVGTLRQDEGGQDLRGIKATGAYRFNQYLLAGAGLHLDVLERSLDDDDGTTAQRYWLYGVAYLSRSVNLEARFERIKSDIGDHRNHGRLRLNILF